MIRFPVISPAALLVADLFFLMLATLVVLLLHFPTCAINSRSDLSYDSRFILPLRSIKLPYKTNYR